MSQAHIHSQEGAVSLRNKLPVRLPRQATQQLSHRLAHPSLVVTSAATSVAPAMPPPTQLPPGPLTIPEGWGNQSGYSGHGLNTNTKIWPPIR